MKYKETILKAFEKFGFTARDNQIELVNNILTMYLDQDKKYVVLSSPTGTGKSIIGVIAAECLYMLDNSIDEKFKSYILMHRNILAKQYKKTFQKYTLDFLQVEGAGNYECNLLESTADNCAFSNITDNSKREKFCYSCRYKLNRSKIPKIPHVITNNTYFFIQSLYLNNFGYAGITVFDEAQILNDTFCSFMEIKESQRSIEKTLRLIDFERDEEIEEYKKGLYSLLDAIIFKKITDENYLKYLKMVNRSYVNMLDYFSNKASSALESNSKKEYVLYSRLVTLFKNKIQRFSDFETYKYEHVVDINDNYISIIPIFIGNMFKYLEVSKYYLFMSATIDDDYIKTTLNLNKEDIGYIKSKPVFPVETKKVLFSNHEYYNYSKLKSKKVLDEMGEFIIAFLNEHKTDNGIILTQSFYINKVICDYLYNNYSGPLTIIEHQQGTKLDDIIEIYKKFKHKAVLVSPSLFEGVDLPGEYSRFQIMVKAPYPSLADKRIKYILNKYPKLYKTLTIYKIIQGFGRSTRNKDDYSITYCLDANIESLFNSSQNKWKDEFKLI